jgi:hypothetical protein
MEENTYFNCYIEKLTDPGSYMVYHRYSKEIIYATGYSQALKIAKLLELDYRIASFCFGPQDYPPPEPTDKPPKPMR